MNHFLSLTLAIALAQSFPWGKGESVGEKKVLAETTVCTDGKSHYVVVTPHPDRFSPYKWTLLYGTAAQLAPVLPANGQLGSLYFKDPRFFQELENRQWRGEDMRVHSEVILPDKDHPSCAVRCGERTTALQTLSGEQATALLLTAAWTENPQQFLPYALLRDNAGRYFYVDRGRLPAQNKHFRLFAGTKGKLAPLQMVDVVSDSEGEIFSTRSGDLRLVIDHTKTSVWVEHQRETTLRTVPVEANLPLIYNELGVYRGARLGTPCDDL